MYIYCEFFVLSLKINNNLYNTSKLTSIKYNYLLLIIKKRCLQNFLRSSIFVSYFIKLEFFTLKMSHVNFMSVPATSLTFTGHLITYMRMTVRWRDIIQKCKSCALHIFTPNIILQVRDIIKKLRFLIIFMKRKGKRKN